MESILNKIPHKVIKTEVESLNLYLLGIFNNSAFELVELKAGQNYPSHKHHNSEAKLYFVLGNGKIILNGKENDYKPGDYLLVEKNIQHGFKVKSQTLILSVNTPPIISKAGEVDVEY